LLGRVDASGKQQLDSFQALQQEVNRGLRDLREAVQAENSSRLEAERKLLADTSETSRVIASEVGVLRSTLQQQADNVSTELDRLRRTSAERADHLSRYVDQAVAHARDGGEGGALDGRSGDPSRGAAVEGQLAELQAAVTDQAASAEKRSEAVIEDLRVRLRRGEDTREREIAAVRRDAERAAASTERRAAGAHEELRARLESYVKHFDATIVSMHQAILRSEPHEANIKLLMREEPLVARGRGLGAGLGYGPRSPMGGGSMMLDPSNFEAGMVGKCHQYTENGAVSPDMHQLTRRYQTLIEGLQVRILPDITSEVYAVLEHGAVLNVQSLVVSPDSRCWAQVALEPDDADGPYIGYVPESTDSGNALLRPVDPSEIIDGVEARIRPYGHDLEAMSAHHDYDVNEQPLDAGLPGILAEERSYDEELEAQDASNAVITGESADASYTTEEATRMTVLGQQLEQEE
jgi:hypothetical protein